MMSGYTPTDADDLMELFKIHQIKGNHFCMGCRVEVVRVLAHFVKLMKDRKQEPSSDSREG